MLSQGTQLISVAGDVEFCTPRHCDTSQAVQVRCCSFEAELNNVQSDGNNVFTMYDSGNYSPSRLSIVPAVDRPSFNE